MALIKLTHRTAPEEHKGTEGLLKSKDGKVIYNDYWLHSELLDKEARESMESIRPLSKSELSMILDLSKAMHMLNKGKLVRRKVTVKKANGKIFSRWQWVDPSDGNPDIHKPGADHEDQTTYRHHTDGIKDMERKNSARYPVIHHDTSGLHMDRDQKVNRSDVEKAKEAYHRGEALPPVAIDHTGKVLKNHHIAEMAKELGLTHTPSIVFGNTTEKKRLEDAHKEHTIVTDEDTGKEDFAHLSGQSNRTNVITDHVDDVNQFENFTSKRYTKQHIMNEARAQGIKWNESTKDGQRLDDYSQIMWMRAYQAIREHIASGKGFEVRHTEKDVDARMEQDKWDSIHKHFMSLQEKHPDKQAFMEWGREHGIVWKESKDPSINWMKFAEEVKKQLAQGKMIDGVRTRQKEAMKNANRVVTDQMRDMVTALGSRYGKRQVMDRASALGIEYDPNDKKGNPLPLPIEWMRASTEIQKWIADGNQFTMGEHHDPTNGMTATVGDYGDDIKLSRLQAVAVDLAKRNSQMFEPEAKQWGMSALRVDNPGISDAEAGQMWDVFTENARNSKVMIHFDPFELVGKNGDITYLEQLSSDGMLKNGFQSGTVDREAVEYSERELFSDAFDDAEDNDRPVYGVMDLLNNGLGSNNSGSVAFVLKDDVKKRSTGTYTDAASLPYNTEGKLTRSLEDPHHLLVDRWHTKWKNVNKQDKGRSNAMYAVMEGEKLADPGNYFSAQIHGGVDLRRDIDHILVPADWSTDKTHADKLNKLKSFADMHGISIKHEGE